MANGQGEQWRSRIVGSDEVNPQELLANPLNFRVHPRAQREAMEATLDTIGWIQQPIVNRTTGHVIDGHMRIEAAIKRGETRIPVLYVELSEDEERAALASLDPISAMAVTDSEQLLALTDGLETGNAVLDEFLAEQRNFAEGTRLKSSASGKRVPEHQHAVAKAVLPVADLDIIERALAATGCINRADAFLTICRSYLERAERQHDAISQSIAAVESAAQTPAESRSAGNSRRTRQGVGAGVRGR